QAAQASSGTAPTALGALDGAAGTPTEPWAVGADSVDAGAWAAARWHPARSPTHVMAASPERRIVIRSVPLCLGPGLHPPRALRDRRHDRTPAPYARHSRSSACAARSRPQAPSALTSGMSTTSTAILAAPG